MEITQNSIIRLVVRQGSNSDRLSASLVNGEIAYTTDTKRLFVGDSVTSGGNLVGNKFLGSGSNVTAFAPGYIGDTAFNSDTGELYRIQSGDGSVISNWQRIGGNTPSRMMATYNGNLSTISVSSAGLSVSHLSAGHYRFSFPSRPDSNMVVTTQIVGLSALGYQSRPIAITNSYIDVALLSSNGSKTDGTVSILINY